MKRLICIFLSFLLMTSLFSACSVENTESKDKEGPAKNETQQEQGEQKSEEEEDVPTISSVMLTEEEKEQGGEKISIVLFFTDDQATKLVSEKRFIDKSKIDGLSALLSEVLKELFKGPISGNLSNVVPEDAPVPAVEVKNKTATVDFSEEFVQKHPGGSTGEIITIYSIVNTLTEIEGIDQVQFTIDGSKKPEFKGHIEFDKPFKPNKSLIEEKE